MKKIILLLLLITLSSFSQILRPGDGVRLTFYNIPDNISGDYYVQQNYTLQLPFIGVIDTQNDSVQVVLEEIKASYDTLYKNPELTIQPLYRINILGEVNSPGSYYVTGFETISDIIAQAGGETSDAALDDTYIVRNNEEIEIDVEEIVQEGNKLKDIGLKSGDKIYVPRKWWVAGRNTAVIVSGIAALVTILLLLFTNN